jgi:glycosyltransferase involved in cell wall biosynthesis
MKIAIYNLHMNTLGGGERRTALLASHLSRQHEVILFVDAPIEPAVLANTFAIDVSRVRIVSLAGKNHLHEISATQPDIFINNSAGSDLPSSAPYGIYMCMFPFNSIIDLTSYAVVTANSAFTARWIKRRWHIDSEVVYSACRWMGPPGQKRKVILNVGRFYQDDFVTHHKRQDVLVEAFASASDLIDQGWSLHLAGNVHHDQGGPDFVDQLTRRCRGLPVRILPRLPFHELRDQYREAGMYWHATGFGSSEEEQPQRQEHFGMTILEAMSAGAVPIAHRSGGPCEVIRQGANGYLWSDLSELVRTAQDLAAAPETLQTLSAAAIGSSLQFTEANFLHRMDALIGRAQPPEPGVA